ncbi:MAG: FAD-dependent oxidoreductase [Bryobacteraceae bacterium]
MGDRRSCVIVGAGMAGLTAAEELNKNGWRVTVLDKGRRPGGRMATRSQGEMRFDHGAQFFTVRDARFAERVASWGAAGWVKPWFEESGHTRYCGVDGMNRIMCERAKPLDVRLETTVSGIESADNRWLLRTQAGEVFEADALVMTPPVPQTLALIGTCALPDAVTSVLRRLSYQPCFAVLASLDGSSAIPSPGCVQLEEGPIAFLADNTQKGISQGPAAITIHASPGFTREFFDAPYEDVARRLLEASRPWLGSTPREWQVHRWKFSLATQTAPEPCLFSSSPAPVAFAGDALCGARIEGAFLSGLAAAARLLQDFA